MVFGFREVLLELQDVADIGAAPGVDALVFISHDADVVLGPGQQLHQLVLRPVGVLILVDQQVAIAAVVAFPHFAGGAQHAHRLEQQVVKIQRIRLAQFLAINLVDVRDPFGHRIGGLQVNLLRVEHVVLGPGDARENRARRQLLGVKPHAAHRLLDDGLLIGFIVDHKVAGKPFIANAQRFDVAAQNAHAKGVKGGQQRFGQRPVLEQLVDPLRHLCRRFVGKRDREDGIGRNIPHLNEIRDAVGNDPGLAGARPSQNQQGAIHRFDGGTLLRI